MHSDVKKRRSFLTLLFAAGDLRRYVFREAVKIHLAFLLTFYSLALFAEPEIPLADKVLVDKSERKMWLIHEDSRYREYEISLGDNPIGHKQQEGDEKTPEGKYTIDYRNPNSSYHLSLHITYPSAKDKGIAKKRGVSPGGDIFIHGLPNGMGALGLGFKNRDWTDGCIAVNNKEIEEIWSLVKNGTPIEILP